MRIFVTVGTTKFLELVDVIVSKEFSDMALSLGYHSIAVQHGSTKPAIPPKSALSYELFDYKTSLHEYFEAADLVISHAGSGSILESLDLGKPTIVVVNEKLMDNHQLELAKKLSEMQVVFMTTPSALIQVLESFPMEKKQLKPFVREQGAFARILHSSIL